jgi:hypothetical protein
MPEVTLYLPPLAYYRGAILALKKDRSKLFTITQMCLIETRDTSWVTLRSHETGELVSVFFPSVESDYVVTGRRERAW